MKGLVDRLAGMAPKVRRYLAIVLIVILTELLVEFVNPFGIQDAVKARAAEVLQQVSAPFYNLGHETPGQKVVTVVLIDEAYFRAIRPDRPTPVWPMPVDLLTLGVIQRIVDAQPAAVFVDIGFPDAPREVVDGGKNSRSEAIARLAGNLKALDPGVPVFLGDSLAPTPAQKEQVGSCKGDFLVTDEVRTSNIMAAPLLDQLFGQPPQASLAVVDASWPGDAASYALAPAMIGDGNCLSQRRSGEGYIASPALALFKAFGDRCPSGSTNLCARPVFSRLLGKISFVNEVPSADGLQSYRLDGKAAGALSLRWGVGLSDRMKASFSKRAGADACLDQFYEQPLDPLITYGKQMFSPLFKGWSGPGRHRCVYIDTISAADLVDGRRFGGANARLDPVQIEETFLKDRIVLLGVNLPQAGDKFSSPVNGAIPGVFIHAAAVENLVTYGVGYHTADAGPLQRIAMTMLIALLTVLMAWMWDKLTDEWFRGIPGWGPNLLAPVSYLAVMCLVGSAVLLGLSATDLPLTEIVAPLIALHIILFSGLIERWKSALSSWITPDAPEVRPSPAEEPSSAAMGGDPGQGPRS